MKPPAGTRRVAAPAWVGNLALLLASLVICLGLLEAAARVFPGRGGLLIESLAELAQSPTRRGPCPTRSHQRCAAGEGGGAPALPVNYALPLRAHMFKTATKTTRRST